jgi:hypothetical protein
MREKHKDPEDEDLSAEIIARVERRPGDQVKCSRVYGRRYRCNWWCAVRSESFDNPSMKGGQIGAAHTIRKSQFLEVTREAGGGLRIDVISTSEDPTDDSSRTGDQGAGSGRART